MTILTSVMQFAMLPLQGIAQGSQPIASYNYGAKNADRVKKTFRLLVITCLTYSTLLWDCSTDYSKSIRKYFYFRRKTGCLYCTNVKIYLGGLFLFGIQIACQITFTSTWQSSQLYYCCCCA
ncbi:MAG: MATE family efflux transporter [Eubacterium ventriosum]